MTSVGSPEAEALADELLRCACLSYGHDDWPDKWRRAERIRALHPQLARWSIHAACVTGELEHVTRLLAGDPSLATRPGGPQDWPPLLFVCYGRIPHAPAAEHALAIARALLDHGADPRASFLRDGTYRFTALTGAIGKGELGQPPHPHGRELALLLLERGADPGDGQGLYNDMLAGDDDGWLRLLLAHGLTAADPINWERGVAMRLLDYLLGNAVRHDHRRRARCLLEHGANPEVPDLYNQKTAYENAVLAGNLELAELMVEHGAVRRALIGRDAFVAACARLDAGAARAALDGHPELLDDVDPLIDAAERGRGDVVRLLLDLGMTGDRAGKHDKRALHVAAGNGSAEIALLLLSRGADPSSTVYGGTAASWAQTGGHAELARSIAERSRTPHDAAQTGHVTLLSEVLADDPGAAQRVNPNGDTPLHRLPDELDRAREIVQLLLRHGADRTARDRQGRTAAEAARARGLDELVALL